MGLDDMEIDGGCPYNHSACSLCKTEVYVLEMQILVVFVTKKVPLVL